MKITNLSTSSNVTLAVMHSLQSLFDALSLSPKKKVYDEAQSTLLQELSELNQPIVLCYTHTKRAHFVIDLKEKVITHASLPHSSTSFYIDDRQTTDRCVVFAGRGVAGQKECTWEVRIKDKVGWKKRKKFEATVVFGEHTYYSRTIYA